MLACGSDGAFCAGVLALFPPFISAAVPVPDFPPSDALLQTLLHVSLTAVHLVRPLYGPDGVETIDFALEYLNPAGQRMTGLPEHPGGTVLTRFPHAIASGIFEYYRRVFESGETSTYEANYQVDGLDNYFHFAAQPCGEVLVVSFNDTADHNRSAVEQDLRDSQTRERAARADTERERTLLQAVLMQASVAIGLFWGDNQVVAVANDLLCAMWGYAPAQVLGRPLLEGVPELCGQGFTEIIAEVTRTQVPFVGPEMPAQLLYKGIRATHFFNFVFQPLYDESGALVGVLVIAIDATEQVRNRQQVQALNEEMAAVNGALQAANEEFLLHNAELARTQAQLRLLNEQLEARVLERTQAAQIARAEAEKQQTELQQILTQAPVAIAVFRGSDYIIELANPTVCALWGRTTAQTLGTPLFALLPEIKGQGFKELLDGVMATGVAYTANEVPSVLNRQGQRDTVYWSFVYHPLRAADGQITGVIVVASDVSEQVAARRAVEVSEHQFRTFLESIPQMTWTSLSTGEAKSFNQRWHTYTGLNFEQTRDWGWQAVVHPDDLANTVRQFMHSVRTGDVFAAEQRYRRADGTYRWHLSRAVPLRDETGQVILWVGTATDIDEQVAARHVVEESKQCAQALADRLLLANKQLLCTNQDLDNFIYTASHDLKAPISNLDGLLHVLREQLSAEVRQDEAVESLLGMMQRSIERFQLTIVQLTDLTKLQQAYAQPAEAIDLAVMVEAVRLDLAPLLAEAGAQLTVDVAACPTVLFAPKNLRSIVYNLLSNAVKYRDSGRTPVVQLRAHREAGAEANVVLEVQDNGLGLDTAQQAKLFGMFQRLHAHVEGSGVGLYMVKKIVENAGGTVAVRSEPGVGSTFIVRLPG